MKKHGVIIVSAILFVGAVAALRLSVAAPAPRVISIIADKDNRFKIVGSARPIITASPGEVLKLQITAHKGKEAESDGAVHSVTIKSLKNQGWDLRLYEGMKTYTVVAPKQPGTYIFECTIKCGGGHDDMRGKLIVQ